MVPRGQRVFLCLAFVLCVLPSAALATFPGENGKLAFNGITTMNPDGTGITALTPGVDPNWSPDGTQIAFSKGSDGNPEIYVMNADGSNQRRLTTDPAADLAPAWSPDGGKLAFITNRDGNQEIYVMRADGSGQSRITNTPGNEGGPDWSPSGDRIAFVAFFRLPNSYGVYTVRPDGSERTFVLEGESVSWAPNGKELYSFHTYYDELLEDYFRSIDSLNIETGEYNVWTYEDYAQNPVVSPDNSQFHYHDHAGGVNVVVNRTTGAERTITHGVYEGADWQPLQRPYARPLAAGPVQVPLVTAFEPCTGPNREHGPPLAYPSCNPPMPASPNLIVSAGEAYQNSTGFVRLKPIVGAAGEPDDSDVLLHLRITNVMNASDRTDYTGVLRPELTVRLTDRDGFQHQTTQDFPFGFDVPCTATASTTVGGLCDLATTADAVVPGSAPEGTRAIWQLDQVKVYDGGPAGDGVGASLFAVQGVFVP